MAKNENKPLLWERKHQMVNDDFYYIERNQKRNFLEVWRRPK